MIQRIQTMWLLLASIALFCLFLFPYIHYIKPDGMAQALKVTGAYEQVNGQIVQTKEFLSLTIATVVAALLPLLVIFYYHNRKRQIVLSYAVIAILIGYGFWLAQHAKSIIGNVKLDFPNYGVGAFLPSIAILFIIMALKGIRNDEKLIKSADRLR